VDISESSPAGGWYEKRIVIWQQQALRQRNKRFLFLSEGGGNLGVNEGELALEAVLSQYGRSDNPPRPPLQLEGGNHFWTRPEGLNHDSRTRFHPRV
jgi:hypothetical protein